MAQPGLWARWDSGSLFSHSRQQRRLDSAKPPARVSCSAAHRRAANPPKPCAAAISRGPSREPPQVVGSRADPSSSSAAWDPTDCGHPIAGVKGDSHKRFAREAACPVGSRGRKGPIGALRSWRPGDGRRGIASGWEARWLRGRQPSPGMLTRIRPRTWPARKASPRATTSERGTSRVMRPRRLISRSSASRRQACWRSGRGAITLSMP